MSIRTDQPLALRVRNKDSAAYGELVQRHQTTVFNVCYRLMGEQTAAEDMSQEAFMRAYTHFPSFDPSRPFGPWINRIAVNICLNYLQKKRLQNTQIDDRYETIASPLSNNPEQKLQEKETTETIRVAILSLPPHYRAVIELRHYQNYSYKAIATTLNLSLSTVRSHLFRARKILAARLKDNE